MTWRVFLFFHTVTQQIQDLARVFVHIPNENQFVLGSPEKILVTNFQSTPENISEVFFSGSTSKRSCADIPQWIITDIRCYEDIECRLLCLFVMTGHKTRHIYATFNITNACSNNTIVPSQSPNFTFEKWYQTSHVLYIKMFVVFLYFSQHDSTKIQIQN